MAEQPPGKEDHALKMFEDPEAIRNYAQVPPRFVPGYAALHRMTAILLAERAPANARVLVLGAGGGLELKALALAHPGWTFVGVDPSRPMLDLAKRMLGPLMSRIELVEGYIEDAPAGPFDAATCLLTLHFLDRAERSRTVAAIHRRLRPGGGFVAAHSSFPQGMDERPAWLDRYAAFAVASGADPQQADAARDAIDARLTLLDPAEDEAIFQDTGFADVAMFFAAFTWRGWIGHA